MSIHHVIGLMSGSSLDGLDIIYCSFEKNPDWTFDIIHCTTEAYSPTWIDRLKSAPALSAKKACFLHVEYGHLIGKWVAEFLNKHAIAPADILCIGSHGHTVFHYPDKHMTWQIGEGAAIAAETGVCTVCDFRSGDIAYYGQGAPIVPIGEVTLFPAFDAYLNIGGIANLTVKENNNILAYDVVVANQVLNILAQKAGADYDDKGNIARSGQIHDTLFHQLQQLDYYTAPIPKSLNNEYKNQLLALFNNASISTSDQLRTYTEHIAAQIGKSIEKHVPKKPADKKLLITGGGAYNTFLIEQIQHYTDISIVIPDDSVIHYKEALIMAFLAVRRLQNEVNVLRSVTGAKKNTIGGAIYMP